jgi:hypothetical protein
MMVQATVKKTILSVLIILFAAVVLSAAEKKDTLAKVAVLNYINNTGSKNYEWLQRSLGDAVFESMRGVFDFNRINPADAENIAKNRLTPGKSISSGDGSYIADKTGADIVVLGEYDYDKANNTILIKTKIFHASRNSITGEIKTESKADNTLFQVVDKVAGEIVAHISVVAKEDIARMLENATKEEKAKKVAQANQKGKITLQSAESLKTFSTIYFTLNPIVTVPLGVLSQGFPMGVGAGITLTNSFSSFLQFGGSVNWIDLIPAGTSTFSQYGMMMFNFQLLIGLNVNIKNAVFIQPYLQAGISMELASKMELTPTGGNPPYKRTDVANTYLDVLITLGFKMPIRAGRDIFVTPFVEFTYIPNVNQNAVASRVFMGLVNFGVGVSL